MSYEERGVWAYLVAGAGGYLVYLAIVVSRLFRTPVAQISYVAPLIVTTVVAAIIALVARSAVEVAKPSDTGQLDVRDRDIARFADSASRWCLIGGSIAGCSLAVGHFAYFWIANATFLALMLWLVVGSVFRIVAYRRGL